MALDPLTAALDVGKTIIDRIWPDKTEEEKQRLAGILALLQGQLQVNQAEAGNPSMFVSGWRPFVGWVCGMACAWNWIGLPVAKIAAAYLGHPITLAPADLSEMMPVLMGMLGLGMMRSYEKVQGVAAK